MESKKYVVLGLSIGLLIGIVFGNIPFGLLIGLAVFGGVSLAAKKGKGKQAN